MKKLVALAALAASAALAQDKPPAAAKPAMPTPPEELKVEKWFTGEWSCKGKQNPGPMGPGGPTASKLSAKLELGGFWMNYHVNATQGPMKGEVVDGFATWDADAKNHMRYEFNPGPGWTRTTSSGWTGDTLVFEGEGLMFGKKIPIRHTFTRKGDNEFHGSFEATGPDGKMMETDETTCTRAAKK